MQGQVVIRPWKSLEKTVFEHGPGTGTALFRRLSDDEQSSAPGITILHESAHGANQHRHMNVVATGVHDIDCLTGLLYSRSRAGVSQSGLLLHR